MKHFLLIVIMILCFFILNAQDTLSVRYWTGGTAFTLSKHRFELGILDESRYGLTNDCEISSYLLKSFLMPNLKIKKFWGKYHEFYFATKHSIFYPSPFMRTVSREGIGGLISPEFDIPDMLSLSNQLVVSCIPLKNKILSLYAGFKFAIGSGELDARTTIDIPYFYPRLAVFYNQPEIDAGIDFLGRLIRCYGFFATIDNYWFFNTSENYFFENNLGLNYTSKKQNFKLELGYKLCFGKYKPGPQWHLLPLLSFAFKL